MATVPHLGVFVIDTVKVAGAANSSAASKRTRAKAQMAAFSNE